MVRTAIHAAVWSTDPSPEALSHVLGEVVATGFDALAVPLRNLNQLRCAEIAACFRTAGIAALGTAGLPKGADVSSPDPDQRRLGEAHLRRVIETAGNIGIEQINGVFYCALGHVDQLPSVDAARYSAEVIHRIAEMAQVAGIRLCVELVNRYETALLNTVDQALDYLQLVDHPNVRLHLDTYHMAIEERSTDTALRQALPKLGYYELDQSHRGRLDEGSLNLRAISAPLVTTYDGFVGVEAFARSRLEPDHADALAIWREHFDDGTALAHQAQSLIQDIFNQSHPAII